MATTEYMQSQVYSATVGGVVYNVTVAVGGTVPALTRQYIVTDYGADPTGVSDSTADIQSAVNAAAAAGGGTVLFPSGTYKIASPFIVISDTDPVRLVGDGAWLDGGGTADHAIIIGNGGGTGYPVYEYIEIDGLWFTGFIDRAIEAVSYDANGRTTVTRLVINNCRFEDTAIGMILACKITSADISKNTFIDLASATSDGATAITVGSKFDVDMADTGNYIIHDNTVIGAVASHVSAEQHAILAFGYNVSMHGNIVKNNSSVNVGAFGLSVKARFANICNNILDDAGSSNDGHIYIKGLGRGDGTTGSNGGECYSVNVANNIIRSTLTDAINASESGISVDGSSDGKDNIHIHGNYIEGIRSNGIKVEGSGPHSDITIEGNNLYNIRRDYGIRYVSNGARLTIRNNRISGFGTDGTQSNPIGIRVDPNEALDVCDIYGNMVSDLALAAGTGTLYGVFIRPSTGATSKIHVRDNTIDMQTNRGCIGLYVAVSGSGSFTTGNIGNNNIYVPGGSTAESFASTGSIVLHGSEWSGHAALTDVAYDDIVVGGASMRLPAAGAPGPSAWKTDLLVPDFAAAGSEYAYFGMQLPHNYVPGTNLHWHVHFANSATIADGQTVIFRFRFTSGPINGVMTALGNADATFTNDAAARAAITAVAPGQISGTGILADTHLIAGGATITGTTFGLSTVLNGRLERLSSDTFAGSAYLLSADAHIQKNRLGSENEYTG